MYSIYVHVDLGSPMIVTTGSYDEALSMFAQHAYSGLKNLIVEVYNDGKKVLGYYGYNH